MKILLVNERTSIFGGVDKVVSDDFELLSRQQDIKIRLFEISNSDFLSSSLIKKTAVVLSSLLRNYKISELQKEIDSFEPDIIHFHNIYNLLSYPVWAKIKPRKAKIVVHLHNYYPFCLNSFFHDGSNDCTLCYDKSSFFPGVMKRCYHNSFLKSLFVSLNRVTPQKFIRLTGRADLFITPGEDSLKRFTALGIPAEKVGMVPNSVVISDHTGSSTGKEGRKFITYIGNISVPKGSDLIYNLAGSFPGEQFVIAGEKHSDYPVPEYINIPENITFTGFVSGGEKAELLRRTRVFIYPSRLPETGGLGCIEAMAYGVPVMCFNKGELSNIIRENYNGKFFSSEDNNVMVKELKEFLGYADLNKNIHENCINFASQFSSLNRKNELIKTYTILLGS